MTKKNYYLSNLLPSYVTHSFGKVPTSSIILPLLLTLTLSACSTTDEESISVSHNNELHTLKDSSCQDHARDIGEHAESVASTAQYLAAAKAMNNCVSSALQKRTDSNELNEQDTIMKMMAVATLNFIKGGDVITAAREVDRFKRVYPNQDLYFSDYTSFLDTATALLSIESLDKSQISSLNISRVLRDEIERKNYWLSH